MSSGPLDLPPVPPDDGWDQNGDVDPVNHHFDATPEPESLGRDSVRSGDEKVDASLDGMDLAEVKIDADKVVIDDKDADGGGGVAGLEDEPPAPAREGPANSSSPIGSGFQGPLSVDNVGDYLKDDNDWEAIDEAARERAVAEFTERQEAKQEADDEAARKQERAANAREIRERKRLAKRAQDFKDGNADNADLPDAFADLPTNADGNFVDDWGNPVEPELEPEPDADAEPDGGANRIPDDVGIGDKRHSIVPNAGPGTPEHIESQRNVDMADFGQQGSSSYELKGQSEAAVQEAIDQSSDAIKTVSAAVVDTLKGLASILNQHHDAIQTLRDIVASSGEEDVR